MNGPENPRPSAPAWDPYRSDETPYVPRTTRPIGVTDYQTRILPVVLRGRSYLRCFGTAFSIGRGMLLTAAHVIDDLYEALQEDEEARPCVLYVGDNAGRWADGLVHLLLPIAAVDSSKYFDIALMQVVLPEREGVRLTLPRYTLAPGLPEPGTDTRSYGYSRMAAEVSPFSGDIHSITVRPNFMLSQGPVVETLANGQSFMKPFPVMQVDSRFDPGMSGGPVFDRSGCVIGVVCSSFDGPGDVDGYVSYASLLGPAFALNARDPSDANSSGADAITLLDLALPPLEAIRANLAQLGDLEVHAAPGRRTLLAYPRAADEAPYWSRFDPDLAL